jgi:hypothetical protein
MSVFKVNKVEDDLRSLERIEGARHGKKPAEDVDDRKTANASPDCSVRQFLRSFRVTDHLTRVGTVR